MKELIANLIKASADRREIRKFAIPVAAVLLAIGLFALWREKAFAWPLIGVSGFLVAGAYLLPVILRPLYVPWMLLAAALGWVMTRFLLTVTFYLMITPIGLLMRLFGKDPLKRAFPGTGDSYWEPWEEPDGGHTRHYKPF
jgi:hypothetical protein